MSCMAAGSSLLVTLLLISAQAQGADEVQLRYNFSKEQPLNYRVETTVKQTQTVNGTPIETEIGQQSVVERSLEKTDEQGNFRLRTEGKELQVSVKVGPLGAYKFDSKSEKQEEGSQLGSALNPIYDRLKNAAVTFTLSPRGEVSALEGLQGLLDDVLKDNPIGSQFAAGANDKSLEMSMAELFIILSEKPVKPGDSWESDYQLDLPKLGKADGKRTYTYEGPDTVNGRKTARIRMTHDLSFDIDMENAGVKVKGKMKIDQSSGIIQFDPEKGEIVSMDSTYRLSGDMNVDANGQLIPVKSEQEQSVKIQLLDQQPEVKEE